MDHYQEVKVALSESVMENCLKRPPGEEITMTTYPACKKTRYLGHQASQINNYYGTLLGSHARSFKIRPEKSLEAPPGGEITMTSYPDSNK